MTKTKQQIKQKEQLEIVTVDTDLDLLRTISRTLTIEEVTTEKVQNLIKNMIQFLEKSELGVGLSAVQIGKPIRIFLARMFNKDEKPIHVFINPEVEKIGTALDTQEEGCLSIPETSGLVQRHKRVKIKYINEQGQPQKKKISGFTARIIQHENDHLNGILFTDKLSD